MSAFQKAKQIHSRQRRVGLRNSDATPYFADAAQHLETNRLASTHGPNVQAQHLRPWLASDTMSFGVLTLNLWNINERLDARYVALEVGLNVASIGNIRKSLLKKTFESCPAYMG